jgi:hypothetical protein
MNPLAVEALGSFFRWGLMILAAGIVKHGIWTQGDATSYVAAASIALVTLVWSIWNKRQWLIDRVMALAMPKGSTIAGLKSAQASGQTADPNTPHDATPKLTTNAGTVPPRVACWFLPFLLAGGLLSASLTLSACGAPVTVVTPAGQVAYTANEIAKRVGELGHAAIAANAQGALADSTTFTIVGFCDSADKILAATPAGWQASVATAWTEAKKKIPAKDLTNPLILSLVTAVNVSLAAYLGGHP